MGAFLRAVIGGDPIAIPDAVDFEEAEDDYIPAPELEALGDRLIERHGAHLGRLKDVRIRYLWRRAGGNSSGKLTLGRCRRCQGLVKHLAGDDFIVELAADNCRQYQLGPEQLEALLFHELSHAWVDPESGKPGLLPHDAEMFAAEVRLYGLWTADLKAVGPAFEQARLGL